MARIKVGVTAHRRHKHILKLAKGYRGAKPLLFTKANEPVMKALMNSSALLLQNYSAFFAVSTSFAKAAASLIAMSASTLRFSSIPALLRP